MAESGQLGYITSNNLTFLQKLESGKAEIKSNLKNISILNQKFPEITPLLVEIQNLKSELLNAMDESVQAQIIAGTYAAHLSINKGNSKSITRKIQVNIDKAESILFAYKSRYSTEIKK